MALVYRLAPGREAGRWRSGLVLEHGPMAGDEQPNPWQYAHMGLELAGAVVVLGLLGLWLDYVMGTGPWLLVVGVMIGAVGGMYLFIKAAIGMQAGDRRRRGGREKERGGERGGTDGKDERDEP